MGSLGSQPPPAYLPAESGRTEAPAHRDLALGGLRARGDARVASETIRGVSHAVLSPPSAAVVPAPPAPAGRGTRRGVARGSGAGGGGGVRIRPDAGTGGAGGAARNRQPYPRPRGSARRVV